MFGDEVILGQSQLTVDQKGRVFIPPYTKREEGDRLVLFYDNDLNVYEIHSFDEIKKEISKIKNKIENSKTKLEKIEYKKELYEYSKSILMCSRVDKNGRALFSDVFKPGSTLLSIGCKDYLTIEPPKKQK